MRNSQGFGVEIIANNRPLTEYSHNGKTYIAAPWNTDYQIRLIIPRSVYRGSYRRYLSVISVDGLDVMNGKRANANSGGYVLTPVSTVNENDIPGFRLNSQEVANFHFGDRRDSYASQLSRPTNVGVIGVIFFSEFERRPMLGLESCGGATRGGATRGGHDMGTEFGDRSEHRVATTTFERGSEVCRFVIEYASYDNLVRAGVISPAPLGQVDPFNEGNTGCQPPKGWNGRRRGSR